MQKQEINLEEILSFGETYEKDCNTVSVNDALIAMKEACNQTLELAAENAEIEGFEYKEDWMIEPFNMRQDELGNIVAISKKSILDTIKQVK